MAKKIEDSETRTENIFRDFYGPMTFIEKSAIPSSYGFKSKKGTNFKGYPDFFRDDEDYLIVVEAKGTDFQQAKEETVYYCLNNKLKNTNDIIGIAIAGQSKDKLQIQHYFFFAGNQNPVIIEEHSSFYNLDELDQVYKNKKYGEALSDEELTRVLSEINKKLHAHKVRDTDRSLFFSGIMIALTNDNFRNSYRTILAPTDAERVQTQINLLDAHYLNKRILESVDIELKDRINSNSKEYSWLDRFAFIKTVDIPLDEYKSLIKTIEYNIYIPFKLSQKRDILGRAYKIFLSRAGKVDNKNIILTPDHIKNLMVRLARLTKDDVVLDTCTGSGGFLMEAMETMTALSHDDPKKVDEIHEKQLIGFETDTVLFALACSNMFLHGDGRTNMLYRSSLLDANDKNDALLLKHIRLMKPTKVIINPPYENNNPILFTRQAIQYLEPNGRLIIIMPSPTLKQNVGGETDELLKEAKLDFVIKMPVDIFREQNRTVYTSIFGFTKTPHHPDDEVLFFQLKSDGLVSVQHKGRIDKFGKWQDIEDAIVKSVQNLTETPGVSKRKKIYQNGVLNPYGYQETKNRKYEMVAFDDLFNIEKGTVPSENAIPGNYVLVTAGDERKTVDVYTHNGEAIVYAISAGGSLGKAHYVNTKFSASNLCLILTEKDGEKYPVNLKFYASLLTTMRDNVIFDIADGTSKLTINADELKSYKVPYIPKEKQDKLSASKIASVETLEKKLRNAQNALVSDMRDIIKDSL